MLVVGPLLIFLLFQGSLILYHTWWINSEYLYIVYLQIFTYFIWKELRGLYKCLGGCLFCLILIWNFQYLGYFVNLLVKQGDFYQEWRLLSIQTNSEVSRGSRKYRLQYHNKGKLLRIPKVRLVFAPSDFFFMGARSFNARNYKHWLSGNSH